MKKALYIILAIIILGLVAWVVSIGVSWNQGGDIIIEEPTSEEEGLLDFLDGADEEDMFPIFEEKEGVSPTACTTDYTPVCGEDGYTYTNRCQAEVYALVEVAYDGECK